jgi:benzoyl-CoA reductase subunit B
VSKGQLWETRPLDFWAKAKELRAKWQQSIENPDVVIMGQGSTYMADYAACFPAVKPIEDNPAGSMIQVKDPAFARKCRLAGEIRGWGREICGYQNNLWGSQFLGYQDDGSPFPLRKFVIPMPCCCDQHTKRGQQCRDFSPVPQWMSDQCIYFGERDEEREEAMIEHRAYTFFKLINDMERIFGQKFDEERMVEVINARHMLSDYARDISVIMAETIPTPLSVKDLYSVYTMGGLTKVDPEETINFWKMVRDEVQWRADNHIAAVGNERYRWIETHPPSWHFLKYYRYMEQYGAVCLGSQYSHLMLDHTLEVKPDGRIDRKEVREYPQDTPIHNREDVVRYMMGPDPREIMGFKQDEYIRREALDEFARIFQANGALLPLWRCGVGCTFTRKEQGMRLEKLGVNVMYYEGSQPGDRTDMDEKRFLDQLDSWMESQGLEKTEI